MGLTSYESNEIYRVRLYRERKKIERKIHYKKNVVEKLCMNNAKNVAVALATNKAKSKKKDQQCIGRCIIEVSELAKTRKPK